MRHAASLQVVDLSSAVDRLSCEKVDLERQFEMEVRAVRCSIPCIILQDSWQGSPATTGWPEGTALHASVASSYHPSCPVTIHLPNRH